MTYNDQGKIKTALSISVLCQMYLKRTGCPLFLLQSYYARISFNNHPRDSPFLSFPVLDLLIPGNVCPLILGIFS